jgi:hypothetical protein
MYRDSMRLEERRKGAELLRVGRNATVIVSDYFERLECLTHILPPALSLTGK